MRNARGVRTFLNCRGAQQKTQPRYQRIIKVRIRLVLTRNVLHEEKESTCHQDQVYSHESRDYCGAGRAASLGLYLDRSDSP